MLILQNLSYIHPDKELLFGSLNIAARPHEKVALVGNNGTGKSSLLRLIAGELLPAAGSVVTTAAPYYVPQLFGQFNGLTVAQALRIHDKLVALQAILAGDTTESNFAILADDWTIADRVQQALMQWELHNISPDTDMSSLSGGQKTRVFLSGIAIHQPDIVLLDEPSNHLDSEGLELLYGFILSTRSTLIVASHNRTLLNKLDTVWELSSKGIQTYGGNYNFYAEQKAIEHAALINDVNTQEKALRKAREVARESIERQQKLDARGKKKQVKAGVPTIAMNTLRNNAEKSTARMKDVHTEKVGGIAGELAELRRGLPAVDKMKFGFDNSGLHRGKVLLTAEAINYTFGDNLLWQKPLSFQLRSGDRLAIKGLNGSGKTTLIRLLLGALYPTSGRIQRTEMNAVYIDQEYSLINNSLTVLQQAQLFNTTALEDHEIKIRLTRFLFVKEMWEQSCCTLSGGQKMRLALCCLTIGTRAPDMIILDEPTNNLDIQNIEILTAAIRDYEGTLLVISHDEYFINQVSIEGTICLL